MQVFVPTTNFPEIAQCLDRARLGKQRVECKQILQILLDLTPKQGWKNHPIMKMWKGYEKALCFYSLAICQEWKNRGYKDNLIPWFQQVLFDIPDKLEMPPWWGDDNVHSSHRQTLLCKDLEWYSQFNWKEEPKYEYVWVDNSTYNKRFCNESNV